jgi:8-oxo-dGTP pyrophosphatase MutT (NUDIX family)
MKEGDGRLVVRLGCIGDGLEKRESPVAALQLEAKEEIGCSLLLMSAGSTIEVSPCGDVLMRD